MTFFDSLKRIFGSPAAQPASGSAAHSQPAPKEIRVREVAVPELMAELRGAGASFVLDCREGYERRSGYIPGSVHIAMREIPQRLAELDRTADIVVACAHGNRSYSIAGYLIEQGFQARSLRGGFVEWQARGGEVDHG